MVKENKLMKTLIQFLPVLIAALIASITIAASIKREYRPKKRKKSKYFV